MALLAVVLLSGGVTIANPKNLVVILGAGRQFLVHGRWRGGWRRARQRTRCQPTIARSAGRRVPPE